MTEKEIKEKLLKEIIYEIEQQREAHDPHRIPLNGSKEQREYYRGLTVGINIGLRVANAKLGELQHEDNSITEETIERLSRHIVQFRPPSIIRG